MKRHYTILYIRVIAALLTIAFTACSGEGVPYSKSAQDSKFEVSPREVTLDDNNQAIIHVTSNSRYNITTSDSWLNLSVTSGDAGSRDILIKGDKNEKSSPRTGYLTIQREFGGNAIIVTVTQKAATPPEPYLMVKIEGVTVTSSETITFEAASKNTTKSFTIESNTTWNIDKSGDTSWFELSEENKDGNTIQTIKVTADNTATTERTATLTIKGAGKTYTINLKQGAGDEKLEVSTETVDFKADGEIKTITVTANVTWSVESNTASSWLTVTKTNDTTLSLKAAKNSTTQSREGKVTVKGIGNTVVITVRQGAGDEVLTVSTSSVDFNADGATKTVTVTANVTWSVQSNTASSWLTVTKTNDNTLSLKAAKNSTAQSREGKVTVKGIGNTVVISVKQGAGDEVLTVSTSSVDFNADGATKTVTVTANVTWSVQSNTASSWLTVTKTNDNTLSLKATKNNTAQSREGKVTVKGIKNTVEITVEQGPGDEVLTVSTDLVDFKADGESKSLTITSNTSWSISNSAASWLTCSESSGTGNKTITLTAKKNTSVTKQEGKLTVTGVGKTIIVTVTQNGAESTLAVNRKTLSFTNNSQESYTVTVTANEDWTVASNLTWCKVEKKNSSSFTVTALPNNKSNSRSATVTVTGSDSKKKVTVSVTQAAMIEREDFGDDKNL